MPYESDIVCAFIHGGKCYICEHVSVHKSLSVCTIDGASGEDEGIDRALLLLALRHRVLVSALTAENGGIDVCYAMIFLDCV